MSRRANGEGSIYESPKGSGRWYATLFIDGKRHKRGPVSRKEAFQKLQELHALRENRGELGTSRQTVAVFLEAWLRDVVKPHLRPKTYRTYADQVRLHIVPAVGHVRLDRLSSQQVQRFLTAMQESGLSASTVNQTRRTLRTALAQARRWRLILENPVDHVRVAAPESGRTGGILRPAEAQSLLDAAADDRLQALYVVSLALGLRQGEALGLTWSDVDLDKGQLTIRKQLQRVDGVLQRVEPKTRRSRRTIALPTFAVIALRQHRTRQLEERLQVGPAWPDNDLVFTTSVGTPVSARNVLRSFKRHLRSAGLPDIRWHDLRHTTASFLAMQGVHQRTAMEILGHSTTAMTTEIYTHVMPEWQRDAASRMNDLLGASGARESQLLPALLPETADA
ncbi:MAG: site-specific integrase, partial [Acidimicrobiales bacterium]